MYPGSIYGAVLRWGRCPQIHLLPPPDSKASWPFWRDFSAPPLPSWWGEGPPPKNPTPALGPSGLVSTGFTVQLITKLATLLIINFKCRPIWSSYFFGFEERRKWIRRWRSWWGIAPPPEFLGKNRPWASTFRCQSSACSSEFLRSSRILCCRSDDVELSVKIFTWSGPHHHHLWTLLEDRLLVYIVQ